MTERADSTSIEAAPELAKLELPHTRLSAAIDRFLMRVGEVTSWVWLLLRLVIVCTVLASSFQPFTPLESERLETLDGALKKTATMS